MAHATEPMVAIVTCRNDFHALAVQQRYHQLVGGRCAIVEADTMATSGPGMTWQSHQTTPLTLPARDMDSVNLDEVNAVWYRRANMPQQDLQIKDPDHRNFADSSNSAALLGILETSYDGAWISAPDATRRAENKLIQLRAAIKAGLAVPRTLVSQDPSAVREFYREMRGAVIMKALRFSMRQPLLTLRVEPHHLANDEAIRLCPTMFQELIPGDRHLRVVCAGDVHAVAVTAEQLDWRPHLDVDAEPVTIDAITTRRLQMTLDLLGLRMGVFDLKIQGDVPVFLEVNPQGQFLFMEGLADIDINSGFVRFLHRHAYDDMNRRRARA